MNPGLTIYRSRTRRQAILWPPQICEPFSRSSAGIAAVHLARPMLDAQDHGSTGGVDDARRLRQIDATPGGSPPPCCIRP
jgi:hypothetical protein